MSFMYSEKRMLAIGAHPIGRPGWPLFAALTPSMDRKRTALMASPMSPGICFATYLTDVALGAAWATIPRAEERLATGATRWLTAAAERTLRTAEGLVMEAAEVCMAVKITRGFGKEKGEKKKKVEVVLFVFEIQGSPSPRKKKKIRRHSRLD